MEDQRAEEIWWENEIRSGRDPNKYGHCPMDNPTPFYPTQYMPFTFLGRCGFSTPYKEIIKEDCYFYYTEHQMGAIIPTCSYYNNGLGNCPCDGCKKYITKSDVYKLVKESIDIKDSGAEI